MTVGSNIDADNTCRFKNLGSLQLIETCIYRVIQKTLYANQVTKSTVNEISVIFSHRYRPTIYKIVMECL